MGKGIKSPFIKGLDDLAKDVEKLCKKYGYPYYFVTVGEPSDNDSTTWSATGNVINEGLVEGLKDIATDMQEKIDAHNT